MRLFDRCFAVSCVHNLSPMGDKFHTWSLRSVFCQVHAPAENQLDFLGRLRRQRCEAFLTSWKTGKLAVSRFLYTYCKKALHMLY